MRQPRGLPTRIKFYTASSLAVMLSASAEAMPLKICTVDWPPYTVSDGRQVGGMHTEMVKTIFKHLDQEVRISQIAWERCLKEVETGGYDAAYSASFKPDRAEYAIYPKVPLQTVSYVVVAAKDTGGGWDAQKGCGEALTADRRPARLLGHCGSAEDTGRDSR